VAARLLELKGASEPAAAVERAIDSGAGFDKLAQLVSAQGGDPAVLEHGLGVDGDTWVVEAREDGHVARVDALAIGRAALALGAGRDTKEDAIDHSVGLEVAVKVGDRVERGEPLATVYGRRSEERVVALLDRAFELSPAAVEAPALIAEEVFA
jgi:thymidine phosphorylase